jgi:hypothetical protein
MEPQVYNKDFSFLMPNNKDASSTGYALMKIETESVEASLNGNAPMKLAIAVFLTYALQE